jgi:hypothetical protein
MVAILAALALSAILLPVLTRWLAISGDRRKLERMCSGNVQQAKSLIEFELQRRPTLTTSQATRRAIASLEKDRR